MNNEEALRHIKEVNEAELPKIKEALLLENSHNSPIMVDLTLTELIIPYKWVQQHPEHFLNCYVTEKDEYQKNKCAGYKWFIKCISSHFDLDAYDLGSFNFFNDKENTVKKAKSILEEAFNSDDIIAWCVEHIKLSLN